MRLEMLPTQRTQAHPGLKGALPSALQMFAKICGLTFKNVGKENVNLTE